MSRNRSNAPDGGLSRRGFLGGVGLGGVGAVLAAGGAYSVAHADEPSAAVTPGVIGAGAVPFYGAHQAGITTPQPARLMFAAFDVTSTDVTDLQNLLSTWTAAAARMCAGQRTGPATTAQSAVPADTGEALGLPPSELTVTIGFGPSLFDDRFGLKSRRPAALIDLPSFGDLDDIDPANSNGDICIQACATDPMVAFHAVRNLSRIGTGTAVLRWAQLGFQKTSGTTAGEATPRNLMGFKDGTDNPSGTNADDMDSYVWVGDETDQPWMHGGSYLVSRRIRMLIENWDASELSDQERTFGRRKETGAPLTGVREFDPPDLEASGPDGLIISSKAHIRLANPVNNGGMKILRRGYSFTDGIDNNTGGLIAGLFFIGYQKDPRTQFVPLQRNLAENDALNEYIRHVSSGIYAVPPGSTGPGHWWGRDLFD